MIHILLKLLIWINKRKLNKIIENDANYDEILKQSQKLDIYINIWLKGYIKFNKRIR